MAPELIYTFECERIVRGWMRSRKRSDSTEFERASADSSNARFVPRSRSLGLGATHVPHKQAVALRPEEHKLQRSLQRVATRKSGSETRTAEHGAEDDEEGRSAKVRRKSRQSASVPASASL